MDTDKILDNLNENENETKCALEFEIGEESAGLVFDEKKDEPTVEENAKAAPEVTTPTVEEEFAIPDSFVIDDKYNTHSIEADTFRVRTTYVPRFTDVSDTYRMKDDPRPRPTSAPVVEEKTEVVPKLVSEESDAPTVEKVIVHNSNATPTVVSDESITVFKFDSEEEGESESTIPDATLALAREIEKANSKEEPVVEVTEEPEELAYEEFTEPEPEKEEYRMPDPDVRYEIVDYSITDINMENEAPEGSSEEAAPQKGRRHTEFTSPIQRDAFKDSFLDTIMSIKVRLFAALLVLAALISIEIGALLGKDFLDGLGLGNVDYMHGVFDLQFTICLFLLAIPEVIRAVRQLIKGKLVLEVSLIVSLIMHVLYTLVIILTKATDYSGFAVLFGFQAIACILSTYFRASGDFTGFKIVSKNVVKNILDKRLTRKLPRENMALDGVIDEYNSKTARMFKSAFVTNFFSRSARVVEDTRKNLLVLGCSFGVAFITGVVCFFVKDFSLALGFEAFMLVYLLSFPSFAVLSHKLPYHHSLSEAALEDSTFVGESSIYECSDVDVIAFEDTEIFGIEDVSIKKIHLYGKAYNTPKALAQMYSLFSVIGGPLDHVFTSSLDRKCSQATNVVINEDGISGEFDGHKICAGTEEYMLRNGVIIPSDDYRTKTNVTDSTKVMYGAEDGEVYVKFFIRYSFSEEFTMLRPLLKERKIIPLIYTRDPNISGDLIKVLTPGEDSVRVMKKNIPLSKEQKVYRRASAGVVTLGDKSNAINMVLLAKRYTTFQENMSITALIAMAVGAVLAVIISLDFGSSLPAFIFGLWHLIWGAVLYVLSRRTFNIRNKEKSN